MRQASCPGPTPAANDGVWTRGRVSLTALNASDPTLSRIMASRSLTPDVHGASPKDILDLARKLNVRSMRLQFTDILGVNKNVEIPASQFEKALAGDIMFDGSSIEGFVRIEESDMLLAPDLATFRLSRGGRPRRASAVSSATSSFPTATIF